MKYITLCVVAALLLSNTSIDRTYTLYGIISVDNDYYYVAEDLTNKIEGIDYICEEENTTCVIGSILEPDNVMRVPKVSAIVITSGRFVSLSR